MSGNPTNTLQLEGIVQEWKVLRYTITGLPVIEGLIQYNGEVVEAEKTRVLAFQLPIILIGSQALSLAKVALGSRIKVSGFMAPISKNSVKFRMHVQHYDLI